MRRQLAWLRDEETDTEAVVTKALGVAVVVALLTVVVLSLVPLGSGDQYTEFYVLGAEGAAADYPANVTVGETATLRVGVGNFEGHPQTYTLVVETNETTHVTQTITLDAKATWEDPIHVTFNATGRKQLRLDLYLGESTTGEPYRRLWLFVEVTSQ